MKVVLEGVRKTYGKMVAVRDIDLTIPDGDFLSIVGPSGCGKTTTLRLIAGFNKPDQGRILFDGEIVNDLRPKERNVGIVFQNYALFPNLTVFENIAFGLRARDIPHHELAKRVQALIGMVELEGKEQVYPRELSGGQQQRVALARALAIQPKVLLLDEPLSALDAKVRLMLRYEIKKIQKEYKITTVYVTHDQEEALSISDTVAVMNHGELLQVGPPEKIYYSPKSDFVASFIGISNFFPSKPRSPERGEVEWEGFILKVPPFDPNLKEILVMVRPERITLSLDVQKFSPSNDFNILEGTVEGRVFLGPTIRLALNVRGKRVIVDTSDVMKCRWEGGEKVYIVFEKKEVKII